MTGVTDILVITPMTETEAREWKISVGNTAAGLRDLLFDGYERQAWRTLGFDTWTDCLRGLAEEYGFSERHMWRLHQANRIENLLTPGSVGDIPEKKLRPLTQLPPDVQPVVWQRAVETAPEGKVTAAHVQAVVNDFKQEKASPMPHVTHNSGNNEWYTPAEYITAARVVMGNIDLDPASNHIANEVVQADTFYTAEDDGLMHAWTGSVWMNPPYASELIGKFCTKLVLHVNVADVPEAIVLVNNATETAWFAELIGVASAVCFTRGRVRFWSPDRESAQPLQGQAIVYIGSLPLVFCEEFRRFGWMALL